MFDQAKTFHEKAKNWAFQDRHKARARRLAHDVEKAFTEHPAQTGESYLKHLWFTVRLSCRLLYTTTVLMIHGVFPFLLTKAASSELEAIYRTLRTRAQSGHLNDPTCNNGADI